MYRLHSRTLFKLLVIDAFLGSQKLSLIWFDFIDAAITDILIAIRALELRVEALEKHRGHTGAVVADPRAPLLHDDNDDDEDDGSFDFLGDSSDDEV